MRISFLIPTFNRAAFLGEALTSICGQASDVDEILVLDDGSIDGTEAAVRAFGKGVRYYRQDNAGKARALNRGLAMTSGEYVWICDDDDVLRPNAVTTLLSAIRGSGAGFVFGRYSRFEERPGRGRVDLGTGYWPDLSSGSLTRHILDDAFVMHNASLVQRRVYAAMGPFSEAMPRSVDYEMFVRLACSQTAAHVDDLIFDQRKHSGARGPRTMLHADVDAETVWQRYDQLIFENLYHHAPLDFFTGFFEGRAGPRQGLLLRASIMARHNCWPEALSDLSTAAASGDTPLTPVEQCVCRRALSGKHMFARLLADPELLARFRALSVTRPGRRIREQLMLGARWRIRHADGTERKTTLQLLCALGWSALPRFLLSTSLLTGPLEPILYEKRCIEVGRLLPPGTIPPVGVA